MNRRSFIVSNPFLVIPMLYVLASFFMDICTYHFMGLAFPTRYYFSIIILMSICGLVFFIKKPSIQFAVCTLFLTIHAVVSAANVISFHQVGEIASVENLLMMRQTTTSMESMFRVDFDYIAVFSLVYLAFIAFSIWALGILKRAKRVQTYEALPYRRNAFVAISTLAIASYLAPFFYQVTLANDSVSHDSSAAYANYNNSRFAYTTFNNRLRIFNEFGPYSYYWSNLAYFFGLKPDFKYEIEETINDDFTFSNLDELDGGENMQNQNVIMLLMEGIEDRTINEITMPNLYAFKQHCLNVSDYHSMNRTYNTEQAALTGLSLDTIEMHTMPNTQVPFSIPWVLEQRGYESVRGFHNFYNYFYNRNVMFTKGYHFNEFRGIEDMRMKVDSNFNRNSDLEMMEELLLDETMPYDFDNLDPVTGKPTPKFINSDFAPTDGEGPFFSYWAGISTHSPYDISLRPRYGDNFEWLEEDENLEYLKSEFQNLRGYRKGGGGTRASEETMSFLAGLYEYDRALGLLFDYLIDADLMDKTTIVFYGDHYNFIEPTLGNSYADEGYVHPAGSNLPFYIHSPIFKDLSITATPDTRNKLGALDWVDKTNGETVNFTGEKVAADLSWSINPDGTINGNGATIKKFMVNWDIYATVCDLLQIETNSTYCLGISALSREVNMGFNIKTGLIYNDEFSTFDFEDFTVAKGVDINKVRSAEDCRQRLSQIFAVMHNARTLYKKNAFIKLDNARYEFH